MVTGDVLKDGNDGGVDKYRTGMLGTVVAWMLREPRGFVALAISFLIRGESGFLSKDGEPVSLLARW